jgi:hypothetical protein
LTKRTLCEEFHGNQLTSILAYCMLTKGKNDRGFSYDRDSTTSVSVKILLSSYLNYVGNVGMLLVVIETLGSPHYLPNCLPFDATRTTYRFYPFRSIWLDYET